MIGGDDMRGGDAVIGGDDMRGGAVTSPWSRHKGHIIGQGKLMT